MRTPKKEKLPEYRPQEERIQGINRGDNKQQPECWKANRDLESAWEALKEGEWQSDRCCCCVLQE